MTSQNLTSSKERTIKHGAEEYIEREGNKAWNAIPWRTSALALLMSDMLAKWLPPCLAALKIRLAEHVGTNTVTRTQKLMYIYTWLSWSQSFQHVPQFYIGSNASCCLSIFTKKELHSKKIQINK